MSAPNSKPDHSEIAKRVLNWWKSASLLQRFMFFYNVRKQHGSMEHGICLGQRPQNRELVQALLFVQISSSAN